VFRSLPFLAVLLLVVAAIAPAQSATPKIPAPMTRFLDVWNNGNWAAGENLFTPDAMIHYGGYAFPPFVDIPKGWRAAFPDFHFAVEETLVDGDKVAMRLTFTGTQQGSFWGHAPEGKHIEVSQTLICHLQGDQLKECWEDWDEIGMRRQLGLIPE
jgi:predicted ester cyclase